MFRQRAIFMVKGGAGNDVQASAAFMEIMARCGAAKDAPVNTQALFSLDKLHVNDCFVDWLYTKIYDQRSDRRMRFDYMHRSAV